MYFRDCEYTNSNECLTCHINCVIVLSKLKGETMEIITVTNRCRLCGNNFDMEQGQRKTLCDDCRKERQGEKSGRPKGSAS